MSNYGREEERKRDVYGFKANEDEREAPDGGDGDYTQPGGMKRPNPKQIYPSLVLVT